MERTQAQVLTVEIATLCTSRLSGGTIQSEYVANSFMTFPSPLEYHLGEVWDPTQHQEEITEANNLLRTFLDDMSNHRVPSVTLAEIRRAADTLGTYAGYPVDAVQMDGILESKKAAASYQFAASVLRVYVDDMNSLIRARIAAVVSKTSSGSSPATLGTISVSEDDIPF